MPFLSNKHVVTLETAERPVTFVDTIAKLLEEEPDFFADEWVKAKHFNFFSRIIQVRATVVTDEAEVLKYASTGELARWAEHRQLMALWGIWQQIGSFLGKHEKFMQERATYEAEARGESELVGKAHAKGTQEHFNEGAQ